MTLGLYEPTGFAAALELGAGSVLGSTLGICLFLLFVSGAAVVFAWAAQQEQAPARVRRSLVLYGTGIIWLVIALLPPIVLGGQYVESRLLYFPWVGLAYVIGSGVALVMTRVPRRWANLMAVGLACLLGLQGLMMAGLGRVYQARYAHDQRQLAALAQAVPSLSEDPVFVLPIDTEEDILAAVATGPGYERLAQVLFGIFETDWSSASALKMLYRRRNLVVATHSRWVELDFRGIEEGEDGTQLLFKGRSWSSDITLAFSYEEGQVVLHDVLVAELLDGGQVRIELPKARALGAAGAAYEEATVKQVER
jgi:hypothetical protein